MIPPSVERAASPRAAGPGSSTWQYTDMPIVPDKRIIFVHIPKTGGNSIEKMLGFDPPDPDPPRLRGDDTHRFARKRGSLHHLTYRQIIRRNGIDPADWFAFAFVRNPWDRMVSEWRWRIERPQNRSMTLADVIERARRSCRRIRPWRKDDHFLPQTAFLSPQLDFVDRFENFQDDVEKLRQRLKIEAPLPHTNRSRRDADYRQYYDRHTRAAVERLYRRDIEQLGYRF